jgi:hypothetical protein
LTGSGCISKKPLTAIKPAPIIIINSMDFVFIGIPFLSASTEIEL